MEKEIQTHHSLLGNGRMCPKENIRGRVKKYLFVPWSPDSPKDSLKDSFKDSLKDSPKDSLMDSLKDSLKDNPMDNPMDSHSNFRKDHSREARYLSSVI